MSSVSELSQSTTERPVMGPLMWKSASDFILACILMMVTAPVILFAMLLVRLTSRGWPLYSQERLGLDGKPFTMFKIRTMYRDCERLTGPRWSTPQDPRVTPIGRILRATHIDELPQLWNILRGEMSLVGPRPERPAIVVQLERVMPNYRERLQVRPGVTGLAQVQLPPDVDLDSVRRKLACDLLYIGRVTPWLDFRIIVGTAFGILGIPCSVMRRVLCIPGEEAIARADCERSGEMEALPGKPESSADSERSREMDALPAHIEPMTVLKLSDEMETIPEQSESPLPGSVRPEVVAAIRPLDRANMGSARGVRRLRHH